MNSGTNRTSAHTVRVAGTKVVGGDRGESWPTVSGPAVPITAPNGLPGLIRERYCEVRDKIVCADEQHALTGHQLEVLSDTLADHLRAAVQAPGPVVLRLRRGVAVSVAMLGVLKAGCAYMPVDMGEPAARLAAMVRQAGPVAVIIDGADAVDAALAEVLAGLPLLTVPMTPEGDAAPAPLAPVPGDQPVYVMFTSGSTGQPKGVMLGSAAFCGHLRWMHRQYPLTTRDRVVQKTPYTFDPSGWEIFWPLIAGARCEFLPDGDHRDPARLAAFISERAITVCHFVPTMLEEFLRVPAARGITTLRHVFCSGEALSASLARRVMDLWAVCLHNLYGPTEAAIDVTHWDVPRDLDDAGPVPMGMPVDNTWLAVVDEEGHAVPTGAAGELYIGGAQLALEYTGRPDLTAAAFPTIQGRRWYRSGDLVRQTRDGLVYLGRTDDQVKIGGVRVEPLEVERVLGELHPAVAVVAVPGAAGPALVAALAGDAGETPVTDEELRRYVAARLPPAFVPAAFYRLAAFPLGTSGKLDRRRLAELAQRWWDGNTADDHGSDHLRSAWAKALGMTGPVDEASGFLRAGGSSLAAIRLTAVVREATGVEVPFARLLDDNISLAALRQLVRAETDSGGASTAAGGAPAEPSAAGGSRNTSPLAPEQRRLWLLGQLYPDSPAYNVTAVLRFSGQVDTVALAAALDSAVNRFDILRARLCDDADGGPRLRYETTASTTLAITTTAKPLDDDVIAEFARQAAVIVINPRRAPMLRAHLLCCSSAAQACLVLVFNHLAADQRTVELVLAYLAGSYSAAVTGEEMAPASAPRYADYAAEAGTRIGDERWNADIEYWRDRLSGAPPELSMPFRLGAGDAGRRFIGAANTLRFDRAFAERLEAHLRNRAATKSGFFLAVFVTVLSAWSGQRRLVIGIPSSRRRSAKEQDLAGFLIDTLPIRLDCEGLRTFDELLTHARGRYTEAIDHARPSFDAVVSALPSVARSGSNPVFQFWLNDLTGAAPLPRFAGLRADPLIPPVHSALFDLGLYLHRDGDGLAIQLVRSVDRYGPEAGEEFAAQCALVAHRVLDEPDVALEAIDLVTPHAAAMLTGPGEDLLMNGHRTDVLAEVAEAAATSPDRVAVATPDTELTYRQLWERAGRAAAGLRALGADVGDIVQVCATRDADLPVAVLACWLAEACAALLDATLPPARREACRETLHPRLTVTTDPDGAGADGDLSVTDLVRAGSGAAPPDQVPAHPGPKAGLSHVLFTSGTTGVPVPVAVPHGPLRDFLRWYTEAFDLRPADRFALVAGPGHDPVLREMFAALTVGGELHVPPPDVAGDGARLLAWLARTKVTVLHATPGLMEMMLGSVPGAEQAGHGLGRLRLIVLGGAPLSWRLVRRIRAFTRAEIVNCYGTTETPQIVSCYRLPAADARADLDQCPIGAGCAGHRLLVLTASGRLAGVGQRGEVVVRSRNLASGYIGPAGRPGRFGPDPLPGVRTFRTGDFGRYDHQGLIRLDGRMDRQVSVGGHRLELDEVEAAALRHPAVLQPMAALDDKVLGPVLTLQVAVSAPVSETELRTFLRGLLPAYAVPVSIRVLGDVTLGATRKATLADGRLTGRAGEESHAGTTPAAASADGLPERYRAVLAKIEGTVLDVLGRRLGLDENFFEAGLNSLTLVELHRVSTRPLADPFPVTTLFAYPNLRALARYLADGESPVPVSPARVGDRDRLGQAGSARRELRQRIKGGGAFS